MSENNERRQQYKNNSKHEEMRRRRAEGSLELRKQRKDEQLMKRRNVDVKDLAASDDEQQLPCVADDAGQSGLPKPLPLAECLYILQTANVGSNAGERRHQAIESVRRHLSKAKNPPIDEVINIGLVPYLISGLMDSVPLTQFEAAWALTNITSGSSKQTMAVASEGAVGPLIKLLSSSDDTVAEQSVWALGNITGESPQLRDIVIDAGILDPLFELVRRPSIPVDCMRTISWTLSNLCRYKAPNAVAFSVVVRLLPVLSVLVHHPDAGVLCDVSWALAYISDGDEDRINLLLKSGVLERLVGLASGADLSLVAPTLRCLGNIVTGDDKQTQAVIDAGVLQTVVPMALNSGKSSLAREGCWLLSNICAGTKPQIQSVLESGILRAVIDLLDKGDARTKTEACWVVYNVCSGGTTEQACALLHMGALSSVCYLLNSNEARVLILTLDCLALLLSIAAQMGQLDAATLMVEECDGLDKVEKLQNSENEDVYQKALQLLEKYFSDTEEVGPTDSENPVEFDPTQAPTEGFNF